MLDWMKPGRGCVGGSMFFVGVKLNSNKNMFIRIVKMRFQEDKIEAFLNNFEEVKHHIRNFEGNRFLELYQDKNDKRIFFTYSYWENEEALEKYRKSALFDGVWTYTKTLFSDKPEAWSVDRLVTLNQNLEVRVES